MHKLRPYQTDIEDQIKIAENKLFASLQPTKSIPKKPQGWIKPRFNSREYWTALGQGWISDEEAEADQLAHDNRIKRAKRSYGTIGKLPNRWKRHAPQETRQYANHMSTEAARDDRLTPNAKALLQVIRARCGKGRVTQTTKFTLGDIMRRSERTIQRYVRELVQFGYIDAKIRRNPRGLYTGLILTLLDKVLPYWTDIKELACDLAEKFGHEWTVNRSFIEETSLSPKNESINRFLLKDKRTRFA